MDSKKGSISRHFNTNQQNGLVALRQWATAVLDAVIVESPLIDVCIKKRHSSVFTDRLLLHSYGPVIVG
jgi:hypothetical protein